MPIRITFTGADRLAKKSDADYLLGEPMRDMFKSLLGDSSLAMQHARKAAKPDGMDTGSTADSLKHRLAPEGIPLWAEMYSNLPMDRARAQEYGRTSSSFPPAGPILAWMQRHGIPDEALFLIQRKISRGTKALKFMDAGYQAARSELPRALNQAAQAVRKRWEA